MTNEQARNQALAASGTVIIAFIGVVHLVVGETIFPWAPAFVGGYLVWYAMGLACLAFGLALLAATLGLIRMPVVIPCVVLAVGAIGLTVLVEVIHGEFHFFAVSLAVAGAMTAWFHRKSPVGEAPDAP
ncbi:MAG: hypothetical protein ACM3W4_08925 [Ignavibacteriales bacterium]